MGPDFDTQNPNSSLIDFARSLQRELTNVPDHSTLQEGTVVRFVDGENMQGDKIYRVAVFFSGMWTMAYSSLEAVSMTHSEFVKSLSSSDYTEVTVMAPNYKVK